MKKKAYVGLSGGVDSAVSAALLLQDGYDVTGVFIKIWQPEFIECTWEKDRIDAMRVAVSLGIPFKEIDLSDEYKRDVVERMIASYQSGETPNPDVTCNEKIKFGSFYTWAREDGADIVATGHYARIIHEDGVYKLLRGIDRDKDQSYFLHRLEASYLSHIAFPVGNLRKVEVRERARTLRLPVAHKHDSQGLCFVGDVSMRDFLRRYISVQEGPVLNARGEVIGVHEGAALYTVGQRHGFRVTGLESAKPHYVSRVDPENNTIIVSHNRSDTEVSGAPLRDMHWLQRVEMPLEGEVQSRYREKPLPATVRVTNGEAYVDFKLPHTVSKGQSLVVYRGDECLGGACIS